MRLELIIPFFTTLIICYGFVFYGHRWRFVAQPGGHRKHTTAVPIGGGVAMMLGLALAVLYYLPQAHYLGLLACLVLITVMGALDDVLNLPSWPRFILQGMVTYLMIQLTDVQLSSLGELVSEQTLALNRWSIPLTVFASIGVINAINMSDGMDGLAASMAGLVLIALILLGSPDRALIWVVLAALSAFLLLNARLWRNQAKLFMGDAGSTMLGLLLAFLLIKNSQSPVNIIEPITALWLLALPLIDTVSMLMLRALRGQSPFAADRNHYHHLLLRLGLSVNQALIVIVLLQSLLSAAGIAMIHHDIASKLQFVLFLVLFAVYFVGVALVTRSK